MSLSTMSQECYCGGAGVNGAHQLCRPPLRPVSVATLVGLGFVRHDVFLSMFSPRYVNIRPMGVTVIFRRFGICSTMSIMLWSGFAAAVINQAKRFHRLFHVLDIRIPHALPGDTEERPGAAPRPHTSFGGEMFAVKILGGRSCAVHAAVLCHRELAALKQVELFKLAYLYRDKYRSVWKRPHA